VVPPHHRLHLLRFGTGYALTAVCNHAAPLPISTRPLPCSFLHCRRVSLAVFGHVLDLDLSFHLSRKTGEVTKVVDRGTAAIQNVLSTILFQIVPQVRFSGCRWERQPVVLWPVADTHHSRAPTSIPLLQMGEHPWHVGALLCDQTWGRVH